MIEKQIVLVEVSHENADVRIREKLSFGDREVLQMLNNLKNSFNNSIDEVFIISTCNRFSIYAFADSIDPILDYLKHIHGIMEHVKIISKTNDTVRHLFETASGLRSQSFGEYEILGQIKKAYKLASESGTVGPVLHECVRSAISAGKLIRTNSGIGKYATSLSGVAMIILREEFETVEDKNILIIGTGQMARLTAQYFNKTVSNNIIFSSHSKERAEELSREFDGEWVGLDELDAVLPSTDIVFGCTNSEVSLFDEPENSKCIRDKFGFLMDNKKRVFIDLGMPRNFNSKIKRSPRIKLFDLDDMKNVKAVSEDKRREDLPKINEMLNQLIEEYLKVYQIRKAGPQIGAYWNKLEEIKKNRLNWLENKIGDVSPEQMKLIEKLAHHIIRDMSKDVFNGIRSIESSVERDRKINAIVQLNNLTLKS